jgi:hypothetical protein
MKPYFTVCGAVIGWCVGIIGPTYGRWPGLYYDPFAHRWLFGRPTGPAPIGYYGLVLEGAACALLGGLAARGLARRPSTDATPLAAAWTATAVLLALAYYAFELWP